MLDSLAWTMKIVFGLFAFFGIIHHLVFFGESPEAASQYFGFFKGPSRLGPNDAQRILLEGVKRTGHTIVPKEELD